MRASMRSLENHSSAAAQLYCFRTMLACLWAQLAAGLLYAAPFNNDNVLVIDPVSSSVSLIPSTQTGSAKWYGITSTNLIGLPTALPTTVPSSQPTAVHRET